MAEISENTRGALLMVGSMTAFTVNDALMKMLSDQWPLFQSIFFRGCGATVLMVALAGALGQLRARPSWADWQMIALRTGAEVLAAFFFITAIFNMPIGEATAILQTLPLTVCLAGAVFLGEAVGWRRMLSILVGFFGVLLIVRPGSDGFTIYSLYALAAVICVTTRDIASRRMSRHVPSLFAAMISAGCVTIFAGTASLTEDWAPLTLSAGVILASTMVVILAAYVCSVAAMRHGDIGFVAPYRYTSVLVALALGVTLFAERPDALTLLGVAIVVGAGLFTMMRERQTRARQIKG